LQWKRAGFVLSDNLLENGVFELLKHDIKIVLGVLTYTEMVMVLNWIIIKNTNIKERYMYIKEGIKTYVAFVDFYVELVVYLHSGKRHKRYIK
jgi:hypothetical protein